jgi:peptidoglycan/LPS O-acetylase OafA/YrhL
MGKQINALTATRGIAATMTVIFHFSGWCFPFNLLPTFFYHGALAVSYFFVLSGFVLCMAYKDKSMTYGQYLKRRVARIVPVYEFSLLLIICIGYFIYKNAFSAGYFKMIAVHVLLLQSYIPDYAMNLNLPGWTLSVEVFFYLLFPLFLVLLKKRPRLFIAITVVVYAISQPVHLYYYPLRHNLSSNIIDTILFNPIIHLNQFLIGMCGALLYSKLNLPRNKARWFLAISSVAVLALMNFLPPAISCHAGLIAPIFMLFIVSLSINKSTLLNVKPLVFLGEISYGLYILQLPVHDILNYLNEKYMHLQPPHFFYFFLCMLILAASVSYVFFEKPLMKKITTPKLRPELKVETVTV